MQIQHRTRCHRCSRCRGTQRTGIAGRQRTSADRGRPCVTVGACEGKGASTTLRQRTGTGDHAAVGRGGIQRASGEREAASCGDIAAGATAAAKAADGQSARDTKVGASRVVKRDSARAQGAAAGGGGERAGTDGCAATVIIDSRECQRSATLLRQRAGGARDNPAVSGGSRLINCEAPPGRHRYAACATEACGLDQHITRVSGAQVGVERDRAAIQRNRAANGDVVADRHTGGAGGFSEGQTAEDAHVENL